MFLPPEFGVIYFYYFKPVPCQTVLDLLCPFEISYHKIEQKIKPDILKTKWLKRCLK